MTRSDGRLPAVLRKHWPPVLLVILGAATYANSLHGPFLFDDVTFIDQNASIRKLWPPYHFFYWAADYPLEGTLAQRPVVSLSIE